jgi:hypothetical protein
MMPPVPVRILILQFKFAVLSLFVFDSTGSRLLVAFAFATTWRFEERLHFFLATHAEAEFLD